MKEAYDGTATYNHEKNELTLNDAVITKTCDIDDFNDGIHCHHTPRFDSEP